MVAFFSKVIFSIYIEEAFGLVVISPTTLMKSWVVTSTGMRGAGNILLFALFSRFICIGLGGLQEESSFKSAHCALFA